MLMQNRPRERFVEKGVGALSDSELIRYSKPYFFKQWFKYKLSSYFYALI